MKNSNEKGKINMKIFTSASTLSQSSFLIFGTGENQARRERCLDNWYWKRCHRGERNGGAHAIPPWGVGGCGRSRE